MGSEYVEGLRSKMGLTPKLQIAPGRQKKYFQSVSASEDHSKVWLIFPIFIRVNFYCIFKQHRQFPGHFASELLGHDTSLRKYVTVENGKH